MILTPEKEVVSSSISTRHIPIKPVPMSVSVSNWGQKSEVVTSILKRVQGTYKLPGTQSDIHLLPVSGGADSCALAILMHLLFPETEFILIFTDTGAEDPEIYVQLEKLERFLGKKIIRLQSEHTLWSLIDKFGGFLPSSQARWCTKELKLRPFEAFLKTLDTEGGQVYTYVGIRADESARVAFTNPKITTEMPFVEMELRREDIFRLLDATVGIPAFYQTRTRSGCGVCPFQRKSEIIGLLLRQPEEFERGAHYEKLSPADQGRHADNAVPVWKETNFAANHLGFPVPDSIHAQRSKTAKPVRWGKIKRAKTDDLFGNYIWAAVEFSVNAEVGDHGVWMQRFVTYSTSRSGLTRQLDMHYQHRLQTAEVLGMEQDEVRRELRYAIYCLQLPAGYVDLAGPNDGYTWAQGQSYQQIKHIVHWIVRALQVAGLKLELTEMGTPPESSRRAERKQGIENALANRVKEPCGDLGMMDRYIPKEVVDIEDEYDERFIPCPMCHI